MSVRDELALLTPRLRRYARALTQASPAPSDMADELVHATFMRILECGLPERKFDLVLQVFAALTQLNRETPQERATSPAGTVAAWAVPGDDGAARSCHANNVPKGVCAALGRLRLEEREALLLVVLEGFNYAQAARILRISRGGLVARLGRARTRLAEALGSDAGAPVPARRNAHLRVVK